MAGSYAQQVTDQLLGLAKGYVQSGGFSVSVKTNYGPEIQIGSATLFGDGKSDGAPAPAAWSLSRLIGLKTAVIVRDRGGDTLAKYGDVPPTDLVRVSIAIGVAGLAAYVFYRGIRSLVR